MVSKRLFDTANIKLVTQNVRGLTDEKMEMIIHNMKKKEIHVFCVQESWRVTPGGIEEETIDGFLILHHGERERSCNRGRLGVAILNKEARQAWKAGGEKVRISGDGRVISVGFQMSELNKNKAGMALLTICSAYAPCSGKTFETRQAFLD